MPVCTQCGLCVGDVTGAKYPGAGRIQGCRGNVSCVRVEPLPDVLHRVPSAGQRTYESPEESRRTVLRQACRPGCVGRPLVALLSCVWVGLLPDVLLRTSGAARRTYERPGAVGERCRPVWSRLVTRWRGVVAVSRRSHDVVCQLRCFRAPMRFWMQYRKHKRMANTIVEPTRRTTTSATECTGNIRAATQKIVCHGFLLSDGAEVKQCGARLGVPLDVETLRRDVVRGRFCEGLTDRHWFFGWPSLRRAGTCTYGYS